MSVTYGNYNPRDNVNGVGTNYSGVQSVGGSSVAINPHSTFPIINLHLSARNLVDMDVITVSDPICVLYVFDSGKWREFARTEVVWNNLNPEWIKFFSLMYVFETRQLLLFKVFSVESDKADLASQDFIGEAQIELSQICSNNTTTILDLRRPGKDESRGTLRINPEQVENSASIVQGVVKAFNLKKMNWIFKNDPLFIIYKSLESGGFVPVYQSEVNRKLKWEQFSIPYQVLCNCDPERPLRISFFDYRSNTAPALIGSCDSSYSQFSEMLGQKIDLFDEHHNNVGKFEFYTLQILQKYSFYDFIRGGIQLNLITAIDFTASNRDPRDPNSLHYFSVDGINQYEKCIRAVGEILCPYDTDQEFPVFGFGAKVGGIINHCFPLTFNPGNPNVHGLDGILNIYRQAVMNVQLSGPTLFAPVIRAASDTAIASFNENRTYTILLIITDGIINDMPDTIDAIVAAGRIPLSIIIVGVGNADFSAMDTLDADDEPLVSRSGHTMQRDLVQFVPFNRFANSHYSVLAAEVLEEIPRQLVEWAEMNGVRPH